MFLVKNKVFSLVAVLVLAGIAWAAVIKNDDLSILFWLIGLVAFSLYSKRRGLT